MPEWNLVGRQHVLAAIAECDRIGSTEFLARYRFRRARASTLWHGGNEYDPLALLGVAHLHATGVAPGTSEIDDALSARVLKGLGFDVVIDEELLAAAQAAAARRSPPAAAAAPRAPRAPRPAKKVAAARKPSAPAAPRRAKPADVAPKVCPTCYMALPATGICDNCD